MNIISYSSIPESFWYNEQQADVSERVRKILQQVKRDGDSALHELTLKFDGVSPEKIAWDNSELEPFVDVFSPEQKKAVQQMKNNITLFAQKQKQQYSDFSLELRDGLQLGQLVIPIEKAGIYVPGGNYPLVSTVFMCAIPARVAGVSKIILATPPDKKGGINPYIAGAAYLAGVDQIMLAGGAQAIGALAYGTETIPRVDIIVGPGNAYVTEAKRQVYGMVGIDFVAGPSEVMIIADDTANAAIVAADLLAQAEHDVLASSILITDSRILAEEVASEIEKQLNGLSTKEIAAQAITKNGYIILVEHLDQAVNIANRKAPEHLEIHVKDASAYSTKLKNYGSLFIGSYAGEILGDYSAGINHTLPTAGAARYSSGLSVANFLKCSTTLTCTKEGYESISDSAAMMANMEGLQAHYNAVLIRKKY